MQAYGERPSPTMTTQQCYLLTAQTGAEFAVITTDRGSRNVCIEGPGPNFWSPKEFQPVRSSPVSCLLSPVSWALFSLSAPVTWPIFARVGALCTHLRISPEAVYANHPIPRPPHRIYRGVRSGSRLDQPRPRRRWPAERGTSRRTTTLRARHHAGCENQARPDECASHR